LATVAAGVLAAVLLGGSARALADPIVVTSLTQNAGATGNVNLRAFYISEPEIGSWTINITYEPGRIAPVSCTNTAGTSACNLTYAPNQIRIVGAAPGGLFGTTVDLATIGWKCEHTGTSPLTITVQSLTDPGGTAMPYSLQHGSVTCTAGPPDSDGDGCSDAAEQQTAPGSESSGGRRNYLSFWDVYDTPDTYGYRDDAIDLFNDIFGVAFRFGATGSPSGDAFALPIPASPAYHTGFDRSAPAPGGDAWDVGPPDGAIDLFTDIFGVAFQFGHACT
jgi:hypothetical protein